MKINANFPLYQVGDLIETKASEQNGATLVKVLRTWYPAKTDKFSEKEEIKHLGLYMSKHDGIFPQLVCKIIESKNPAQLIEDNTSRVNYICLEGDEYNKLHKP
jgi:hypothetical protein